MNIHEYQAKEIFKQYGLPVAPFYVSTKATGIGKAAYELSPGPFIVKCQVHSGARGKAGGVALVETPAQAEAFAAKWLGKRLVTTQSGPEGKPQARLDRRLHRQRDREADLSEFGRRDPLLRFG